MFVAKLWPEAPTKAQQVVYRTYLGGSGLDFPTAVEIDTLGRAYVGGFTRSTDFPITNALDSTFGGAEDGFIARLDQDGSTLELSTYVGGAQQDFVLGLSLSSNFGLYALGLTSSPAPFPLQSAGGGPAIDSTLGGARDAFVMRLDVGPTVVAIGPRSATTAGGTPVTLSGSDFVGVTSVSVGGAAAANLVVVNATTITATTPAGSAGARDVVVTNANGLSSTLLGGYTYVVPTASAPTLTSVLPVAGTVAGGTSVTLTGTNFVAGAEVLLGTTPAASVQVRSPASMTVVTPARTAGTVNVSVTSPDGQSAVLVNAFTFITDFDGDGMDDEWEVANGLDPTDKSDAALDPDGDGANNLKEFTDGTNPRAAVKRYFAEGATIIVFSTRFALLNDDPARTATVVLEFLTGAGAVITTTRTLPPLTRITVEPKTEVAGLADAEFSTTLTSNLEIVADRTMTWDASIYGAHAETAVTAPASTWYLAEGATIGDFSLFYLLQNPNNLPATVTVKYLLSGGAAPVEERYTVEAKSRRTLWVNTLVVQGVSLDDQQLSAVLTTEASTPIIVERAMYLDAGGLFFGAGHESAGVTAPANSWRLAEGATGDLFDLFVLIANPGAATATVRATYLLPSGATKSRSYTVAGNSRSTVWVDLDPELADTAVSTILDSDQPVIVERAMWWPGGPPTWQEAHNSPGARETGTKWVLAEGEAGAPYVLDTYILVANTSAFAGTARVTLIFEDGTAPLTGDFPLPASSRTNVKVGLDLGDASLSGKRFGAIIESLGTVPAQLVVERAMYWTTGGVFYGAGTNALGTRK